MTTPQPTHASEPLDPRDVAAREMLAILEGDDFGRPYYCSRETLQRWRAMVFGSVETLNAPDVSVALEQ